MSYFQLVLARVSELQSAFAYTHTDKKYEQCWTPEINIVMYAGAVHLACHISHTYYKSFHCWRRHSFLQLKKSTFKVSY